MIHVGPVGDDFGIPANVLDAKPVRLDRVEPADTPGTVVLVFAGATEGFWKNWWRYIVDKATGTAIQQYCEDRDRRGVPVYREVIERYWGVQNN